MSAPGDQRETTDPSVAVKLRDKPSTAKRLANFASNLLVTGVILIVGVSFGREVITWWRDDGSAADLLNAGDVASVGPAITPSELQFLEFGEFPFALHRQNYAGDLFSVLCELRTTSQTAIDHGVAITPDKTDAERRMIAATERLEAVETHADQWKMYQIHTPVPMVLGLRRIGEKVADAEWRVVSWSMAVPNATPAGETQTDWTLFTYSSSATASQNVATSLMPAPPGGKRTVSLRTDHGGSVIGYAGVASLSSWVEFYDDLLAKPMLTGPTAESNNEWQSDAGTWRRRFVTESDETIDVVICSTAHRSLRCLVVSSPSNPIHR